jgi:hypothetical protein
LAGFYSIILNKTIHAMRPLRRFMLLFTVSLMLGTLAGAQEQPPPPPSQQEPDLTKAVPGEKKRKKMKAPVVKADRSVMSEQVQPNGSISVTPAPPTNKKVVIVPAQPPGAPPIPVPKKR